ncbi:GntR family transcriptional regulator [Sphaerisporangium rufum]|uniref:GntR family transcriptional regulator n=1 Tax=Sphaerisporangium rufum TaxID=1381558 RepID=A0A919V364_9ACTN|nr:GntR family transcriptional regulator [Sphaerisporangium rufum]GII75990.1 GntR family transcriptional regulator [Sphaerisporangium rufum]
MASTDIPVPRPLDRPDSFTQRTLRAVRDLILSGHFRPGDRVNEAELAEALGVSRGPLREALQQLTSEGLVHRIPHRGTFIPEFGATETVELYELREAIEVMAARLAAERATPEDLAELRRFLDATGEVLHSSDEAHYPRDLDFHDRIVAIAGNRQLQARCREVHQLLHVARSRSGFRTERAHQAYDEHRAILQALETRDPDAADRAMRAHLRTGLAHVRQLFELSEPD